MRAIADVVCVTLLLIAAPAHAHRLDEYLQATTIALEKDRVQVSIRLTPGVAIIPVVLASVDTNLDAIVSEAEQRAYAKRVQRDLSLILNGERLRLALVSSTFPGIETLKEGLGEIQLEFAADAPRTAAGSKLSFENRHQSAIGIYLVNSLVPRDKAIRVTAQNRSFDQSSYELDYDYFAPPTSVSSRAWITPRVLADTAIFILFVCAALMMWRRARGTVAARQT